MANSQITVTTNPPNLVQVIDGSISVNGGGAGSIGPTGPTGPQGVTGPVGSYVVSINGLTGVVTGAAFTGTANTFIPLQSFVSGISSGESIKVQSLRIGHDFANDPSNTVVGTNAYNINDFTSNNTAIGFNAFLQGSLVAGQNTAIGSEALKGKPQFSNTAVGYKSLKDNTRSTNTAIGSESLENNINGFDNVAVGSRALRSGIVGSSNIGIGSEALTSFRGRDTIGIGWQVAQNLINGTGGIYIGTKANATEESTNEIVIGTQAVGLGSNTAVIGAATQTSATIYGLLNTPSGICASVVTSDGGYRVTSNAINLQTGITYTLLNSDNGKLLTFDSGSSVTVTIPSGLPVGFHCTALQLNTNGQVGFTAASGVTLKSYDSLFKITGQDGLATIWSYAPNVYNLSGNLTVGYDLYSPLTSAFTISDFQNIVERSATTLAFERSILENNQEKFASPGTRLSFQTNATDLKLNLYWNAKIYNVGDTTGTIIPPAVNNIGAVLENGTEIGTFTWNTPLIPGYITNIFGLTSGNKTISIVWPYAGGLELKSVELNPGSSITAASVPSTKIAVCGDSISQGFSSTKVTTTWAYLLRNLQNKQVINLANAGTVCEPDHGNALQGLTAIDAVIYMIGFNDYASQTPVNTFKSNVIQWIENGYVYQGRSGGTFYISSTIYSTFPTPGGGITLGSYRQAVSEAVDYTKISLDATNIVYVDGLSLMTNSSDRLDGTIHPNDLGASEIATSFDNELNS
jgi:hypothetical protein